VSGARIDGSRLVSTVLPEPSGPIINLAAANFPGALGRLLSAYIFKVLQLAEQCCRRNTKWLAPDVTDLAVEQLDHTKERTDRVDVDPFYDRSLGGVGQVRIRLGIFFSRARTATGNVPGRGRTLPTRPSSPTIKKRRTSLTLNAHRRRECRSAIGRSNPEPSFLRSAGARLMVMCVEGMR
jgi:hypothetical protein